MTSNWSKMMTGPQLESISFIWYVTQNRLWNVNFVVIEAIWGRIFGPSGIKRPPIDLKWQVNYWSPYLSFDDISYETFIFVVMEVIWGRIFGHSEVKWPPIDLKWWQVYNWSPYLSFDMSLDYEKFIFVVMEVI